VKTQNKRKSQGIFLKIFFVNQRLAKKNQKISHIFFLCFLITDQIFENNKKKKEKLNNFCLYMIVDFFLLASFSSRHQNGFVVVG